MMSEVLSALQTYHLKNTERIPSTIAKQTNASLIMTDGLDRKRQTHRKRIFHFGTLNTQWRRGNYNEIVHEVSKFQYKIVTLTETRKTGSKIIGSYIYLYSSMPKDEHI